MKIVETEEDGIYHVQDKDGTYILCNVSYAVAEKFVKDNK